MEKIKSKQEMKDSIDISKAKLQLERCLKQLKSSCDDNEKIACLMLFTHIMKTTPSLTVPSNKLFHAIGVEFITRLLTTVTVPDGCPWFVYKALALNILTSFSDNELYHPDITQNLPQTLSDILVKHQGNPDTTNAYRDTLQILLLYSRSPEGCKLLIEYNIVPIIIQQLLETPNAEILFDILHGFLIQIPDEIWAENAQDLQHLLKLFSRIFAENQKMDKFDISQKLLHILQSLFDSNMIVCEVSQGRPNSFEIDADCSKNIRKGIQDILQSKCKVQYKYTALCSASLLINHFGISWTITENSNTTFWFVVLSITKAELIMILEDDNFDKIEQQSAVLVACYKILEKTIEFLIRDDHKDDIVLKVHSCLVECFSSIMDFLINLKTTILIDKDTCYNKPIIIATVRVLCSWFSEETNALSEKVTQVLPSLLEWAKEDFGKTVNGSEAIENTKLQGEILTSLLPPLCHFSADETFCSIIIAQGLHITLIQYFQVLWKKHRDGNIQSIITLCNVFLNFCVLQTDLIKNEGQFGDLSDIIINNLPNIATQSDLVIITAHLTLLGAMLFRHRYSNNILSDSHRQFLNSIINFLRLAQLSSNTETSNDSLSKAIGDNWDDILELWFLSLQNIIACSKVNTAVKNMLESSGWVDETKHWLNENKDSNMVAIAQLD